MQDEDDEEMSEDPQACLGSRVTRAVADCAIKHVVSCWCAQALKGKGKGKGQGKKAKKDFQCIFCLYLAYGCLGRCILYKFRGC